MLFKKQSMVPARVFVLYEPVLYIRGTTLGTENGIVNVGLNGNTTETNFRVKYD